MKRNKNGIRILDDNWKSEMMKGCNSANCPAPGKSTSYPSSKGKGATLGKLRQVWPSVKFKSTIGE